MTSIRFPGSAILAMYAGLALSVIAMLVLHVDHATANLQAAHIKAGYPTYGQARIDTATMIYLVYLSTLGVLGVVSWTSAIWAARTGRPWARWGAVALFGLGTSVALFNLLVEDTSGDTGLAPLLGWVGMLPSLAGLAAIVLMWRAPRRASRATHRTWTS